MTVSHPNRVRPPAEQAWWLQASPRERVAFTLGYTAGLGMSFPDPDYVRQIRKWNNDELGAHLCRRCTKPVPPIPDARQGQRRPALCPTCTEAGVK